MKLAPCKVCILLVPLPGRLLLSPRGSWDRWRGVPDELLWSPNPREQRLWQLSSHKSCHGCAQHSPGTICKAEGWRWGQGSAPSVPPWTFSSPPSPARTPSLGAFWRSQLPPQPPEEGCTSHQTHPRAHLRTVRLLLGLWHPVPGTGSRLCRWGVPPPAAPAARAHKAAGVGCLLFSLQPGM